MSSSCSYERKRHFIESIGFVAVLYKAVRINMCSGGVPQALHWTLGTAVAVSESPINFLLLYKVSCNIPNFIYAKRWQMLRSSNTPMTLQSLLPQEVFITQTVSHTGCRLTEPNTMLFPTVKCPNVEWHVWSCVMEQEIKHLGSR